MFNLKSYILLQKWIILKCINLMLLAFWSFWYLQPSTFHQDYLLYKKILWISLSNFTRKYTNKSKYCSPIRNLQEIQIALKTYQMKIRLSGTSLLFSDHILLNREDKTNPLKDSVLWIYAYIPTLLWGQHLKYK